jgi:hypothetical protein
VVTAGDRHSFDLYSASHPHINCLRLLGLEQILLCSTLFLASTFRWRHLLFHRTVTCSNPDRATTPLFFARGRVRSCALRRIFSPHSCPLWSINSKGSVPHIRIFFSSGLAQTTGSVAGCAHVQSPREAWTCQVVLAQASARVSRKRRRSKSSAKMGSRRSPRFMTL